MARGGIQAAMVPPCAGLPHAGVRPFAARSAAPSLGVAAAEPDEMPARQAALWRAAARVARPSVEATERAALPRAAEQGQAAPQGAALPVEPPWALFSDHAAPTRRRLSR